MDLNEIISKVKMFKVSQSYIAARLGVSTATISQILRGTYSSGRLTKYLNDISEIIREKEILPSSVKASSSPVISLSDCDVVDCDVVDCDSSEVNQLDSNALSKAVLKPREHNSQYYTKGQRRAKKLINIALQGHYLALLVGDSGAGKSHICKEMATDKSILYVKMRKNLSVSGVVDTLGEQVNGLRKGSGNLNYRFNKLVKDLKLMEIKLIIADEVDMFCLDANHQFIRKIEIFRELYEAGFSVILTGLTRLSTKLKDTGEDYIARRIKLCYPIGVTVDDIADYCDHIGMPKGEEREAIIRKAYRNGNLGVINNIHEQYGIFRDLRMANELVFTTQVL